MDIEAAELRVQDAKTEHGRRDVHLNPDAVAVLRELRQALDAIPHPLLLVFGNVDGRPRSASHVTHSLYGAMKRAGVPRESTHGKRTFHSLRHTFARIALQNGADPSWLSKQMGHHSYAFTVKRYGHCANEASRRQAERLEGAFGV